MNDFDPRNDGLLRGSRENRSAEMKALSKSDWDLACLLNLHRGLLDHAHEVAHACVDALHRIAARQPNPISVTPLDLLYRAHDGLPYSRAEFIWLLHLGAEENIARLNKGVSGMPDGPNKTLMAEALTAALRSKDDATCKFASGLWEMLVLHDGRNVAHGWRTVDFEEFVKEVIKSRRQEFIAVLERLVLSNAKKEILRKSLRENPK